MRTGQPLTPGSAKADSGSTQLAAQAGARGSGTGEEAILCNHCGRTASNGISCQGSCVADSGY